MGVREIGRFLKQWQMEVKDLRRRMILAPTPWERERWYAISLLAQGWTSSATAEALERDPHTIGRWASRAPRNWTTCRGISRPSGVPPEGMKDCTKNMIISNLTGGFLRRTRPDFGICGRRRTRPKSPGPALELRPAELATGPMPSTRRRRGCSARPLQETRHLLRSIRHQVSGSLLTFHNFV